MGMSGITGLLKRDATKLGALAPFEPFTLMFCDPPYRKGLAERALDSARGGGWLATGALVVVEEAADVTVAIPEGYVLEERREAGETQLLFLRPAERSRLLLQEIADLRQQHDIGRRRGRLGRCRSLLTLQPVHALDHHEHDGGDDHD